eukprot:1384358-Amphidinium_carterae.1
MARSNVQEAHLETVAARKHKVARKEKEKVAASPEFPSSFSVSSSSASLPVRPLNPAVDEVACTDLVAIVEGTETRARRPLEAEPQHVLPEPQQVEDDVR